MAATTTSDSPNIEDEKSPNRFWAGLRRFFGNWKLSIGVTLIAILLLFSIVGSLRIPFKETRVGFGDFGKAPSAEYPLGTDAVGRDMLALMVHGIHPSLKIGLIAGILGTVVGTVLGLVAGYSGGLLDTVISTAADIMLTIPALMILVVLASYLRTTTIELMALIIALFAWAGPT
ncbi:MAG: hypothetical protein ABI700_33480, partial [Chloroflexota bacterium]